MNASPDPARLVQSIIDQCEEDATNWDSSPFTGEQMAVIVGQMLGNTYALAQAVKGLLEQDCR